MIADELRRLLEPEPLGPREVRRIFAVLVAPATDEGDRAALLVALSAHHRGPAELAAFARELRHRATPFLVPRRDRAVDLCGSGGASRPSFNVSTVAALVARAAGARVVKHGNRSRRVCGSSDLLEALGLPVATSVTFPGASYRKYGIAFLHAPLFHPATAAVAASRQRIGIPTIFNRLGPLCNPARPRFQVSGAADAESAGEVATVLRAMGVERGMTMASEDGCDEFSPRAPTHVVEWTGTKVRRHRIRPELYLPPEDRRGPWGALPPSAARDEAERILAGGGGARRGSVLLSAGSALAVTGISRDLTTGVRAASQALDDGSAERLLDGLRSLAASHAPKGRS
jgi:anthranilate phosphoribosyltransferase